MRLFAQTERRLLPAATECTRYLRITFTVPERPRSRERQPLSVALVLDRSGSMGGEKFLLARQAVDRCLGLLSPRDRAALVVFDDVVDLVAGLEPVTPAMRGVTMARLGEIEPRGATDLCAGWLTGAMQVEPSAEARALARVLLLTDGLANHGITLPQAIAQGVQQLRARGVATSTFGVGADFDERLLEMMAESGGGNFYYLQRPEAMLEMLTTELGDALEIAARDAGLVLELPAGVRVESVDGWPVSHAGARAGVSLGDLVAGQEVELVLALRMPPAARGQHSAVQVRFADRESAIDATEVEVTWTVAPRRDSEVQLPDMAVSRAVARAYAARARREAAEHNRGGDLGAARRVLEATARRIEGYAGTDQELVVLAKTLRNEAREHHRPFLPSELKERHFHAYASRKGRDEEGRSRRNRP